MLSYACPAACPRALPHAPCRSTLARVPSHPAPWCYACARPASLSHARLCYMCAHVPPACALPPAPGCVMLPVPAPIASLACARPASRTRARDAVLPRASGPLVPHCLAPPCPTSPPLRRGFPHPTTSPDPTYFCRLSAPRTYGLARHNRPGSRPAG